MEKQFIYADNAATTKMSDVTVKAMLPYLQEIYANASSVHLLGQRSAAALFSLCYTVRHFPLHIRGFADQR